MNKFSIFTIVGISLLTITVMTHQSRLIELVDLQVDTHNKQNNKSVIGNLNEQKHIENANNKSFASAHSQVQLNHDAHKHDAVTDFDFTPYVSKEMADEIRPYTSRRMDGLQVEVDKNGNEYVNLKKRWSHVTISVVDEDGVKHTGEWAPQ